MAMTQKAGLIAKIHVAKKKMALTDDCYRDFLKRVTGRESCAQLDIKQLEAVVAEFKRLGFKWEKAGKKAGTRKLADSPHAKKIRAMWLQLHEMGIVKNSSETALSAYVKRQSGVDDLHWITPADASKIINALRAWIHREGGECHDW